LSRLKHPKYTVFFLFSLARFFSHWSCHLGGSCSLFHPTGSRCQPFLPFATHPTHTDTETPPECLTMAPFRLFPRGAASTASPSDQSVALIPSEGPTALTVGRGVALTWGLVPAPGTRSPPPWSATSSASTGQTGRGVHYQFIAFTINSCERTFINITYTITMFYNNILIKATGMHYL